jgi:hypothetical protein
LAFPGEKLGPWRLVLHPRQTVREPSTFSRVLIPLPSFPQILFPDPEGPSLGRTAGRERFVDLRDAGEEGLPQDPSPAAFCAFRTPAAGGRKRYKRYKRVGVTLRVVYPASGDLGPPTIIYFMWSGLRRLRKTDTGWSCREKRPKRKIFKTTEGGFRYGI